MRKQKKYNKKLVIGLTGNFGSGKSTVAGLFRELGAYVIDADKLARKAVSPGAKAYNKIVKVFGKAILRKNGHIDRVRLAGRVFCDRKALVSLNSIIHPEVIRAIKEKISASKYRIILLDVPLLIESGLSRISDKVIVVKASANTIARRLSGKRGFSIQEIKDRTKNQMPIRDKLRLADFVIDNNRSFKNTSVQVEKIRRKLWKS
ncbi:MAG: dephospho-CoA kinase [Candidatus Omnitrophota bacterium]|jgi:dephospho-CoA kinase|nr:MAG: dephospho-CoA kinase [Candidatus Omnitrophota bacterium]